jgi:nucleoside-diphosphate-sugar epimerase
MEKILITGSNSFVGRNYIRYSKNRTVKEISLFDFSPSEIDFSEFNIVIHLAAIVHQSNKIPENEYFTINRDLCVDVAKNSKKAGVKQFVFLSTVKVYGTNISGSEPLTEDSLCNPNDSYGKSKLEAENALRLLEDDSFTVSIIRTPLVYGEGVKANMLGIMKLTDLFPVLPFGCINNKRSFTFVENLVGYIDCIIEKRASGLFIAKDMESLSTTDLVILISKYLGKKIVLIRLPDILRKIGWMIVPRIIDRLFESLEMNNNKTLEILKFKPPYSVEEGICRMVISYKKSKSKNTI